MEYDWEPKVKRLIGQMQDLLPDHLQIVGVAIENVDEGEGALIEANCIHAELMDVTEADVRQDILGDAMRQYDRTVEAVFGKIESRKGLDQ